MTTASSAKAAALEGLDFIETEEDVKAVEAATLKIQSTFRGKKIRSKFGGGGGATKADEPPKKEVAPAAASNQTTTTTTSKQVNKSAGQQQQQTQQQQQQQQQQKTAAASKHKQQADELSKQVGAMQVQDGNTSAGQPQAGAGGAPAVVDEAERAATKIQAGFKGYKTRKELEVGGKLAAGASGAAPTGQQAAPNAK